MIQFIIQVHILNNNLGMNKMIKILFNFFKLMIFLKQKIVQTLKMKKNILNINI